MEKIYIVKDSLAESLIGCEELEGFREIAYDGIDYEEMEFADLESMEAFVTGLYYGKDERSPAGFAVLYDSVESDKPYTDILLEQ